MEKNTENPATNCCGAGCKCACCASSCKTSCCSGSGLWGSLGRIILGVLVLGGMFVRGMKAGMMGGFGDHRGWGGKGGCMMGGMKDGGCPMMKEGGCGMMKDDMRGKDMMDAQPQPTPTDTVAPATGTTTSGQA